MKNRWLPHTMILAIASNTQSPCFDRGKTKSNGLAQSRRIDVGNPILVTHPTIRKVEPLPWHISIGVRSVIRIEPETRKSRRISTKRGGEEHRA